MATLSEAERLELRAMLARGTAEQHWTKSEVGAALQSVEDLMQQTSTKNAVSGAIEAAVPGEFSGPEKQLLFAIWSVTYAHRQGVG